MKCDNCDKDATVHEVTIKAGAKVEKHLCEQCARQAGMAVQSHTPITQLLTKYITTQAQGPAAQAAGAAIACPACSTTYAQFRSTGLLGCPDCYTAMEAQLGPILQRAHDGATHHVGKTPHRTTLAPAAPPDQGASPPPARDDLIARIQTLRKQLAEAVAAEQYERAAMLRDELARAEGGKPDAPPLPPNPPSRRAKEGP